MQLYPKINFVVHNGNVNKIPCIIPLCTVQCPKVFPPAVTLLHPVANLQPADIGWPTGNGKKLSCSQALLGQATGLAIA